MANFETVKSEKGKDLICCDGYIHKKNHGVYYKCASFEECKGRGIMRDGFFEISKSKC